eukprot:4652066-Prymnesium_polylepis.1
MCALLGAEPGDEAGVVQLVTRPVHANPPADEVGLRLAARLGHRLLLLGHLVHVLSIVRALRLPVHLLQVVHLEVAVIVCIAWEGTLGHSVGTAGTTVVRGRGTQPITQRVCAHIEPHVCASRR